MSKSKNIYGILVLVAVLVISIWFGSEAKRLHFKYDIERFFSQESESLKYYHSYRDQFGHENNFVLIGIPAEKTLFDASFFERLDSASVQLRGLHGIEKIISPTTVNRMVVSPLGSVIEFPLIKKDKSKLFDDLTELYSYPTINSGMFSQDSTAVMLYLKKADDFNIEQNNVLLAEIKQTLQNNGFLKYHLAGRINTQPYYINTMAKEMRFFIIASLALLITFLLFTYRNIWLITIPIIVVVLGAIWTMGVVSYTGYHMDLLMIILPSLIFVLGISNSIHLISKYRQSFLSYPQKLDRIRHVLRETGMANLLTSLTTSVGFLCLLSIPVVPVQMFGVYAAVGVMLTFLVSLLLVPSILFLVNPKPRINDNQLDEFWKKWLDKIYMNVLRYGKRYMWGTLIITVVSIGLLPTISLNNYFLDDLSDKSELKQDLQFFEEKFNGIRPLEVGVKLKEGTELFDLKTIQQLDSIEQAVQNIYGSKMVIGPAGIMKSVWQALNDGASDEYRLPRNKKEVKKLRSAYKKYKLNKRLSSFIGPDFNWFRISTSIKDFGSQRLKSMNAELEATAKSFKGLQVNLTGTAYLADETNYHISVNLIEGLLTAVLLIVVLIGFLFRSVKVALLSLIPNLFPLLVAGAVMAICGIDLKISTAVIFTISLGIAVDDTIHFLFKVRKEFKKSGNIFVSVKSTFLTTGKALVITSIVLISGFIVFVFSEFNSLKSIGGLVSLTLLIALIADLFLLPPILIRVYRNKNGIKQNDL